MGRIYLVRHGSNDFIGKVLISRSPGIHLNEQGRKESEAVARYLKVEGVTSIFSSPMERARETAEVSAKALGLKVEICEGVNEVEFGAWTNRTIADLERDPAWLEWYYFRSGIRVPNGESMLEIQHRVVTSLEQIRLRFPTERVAVFSHGDPIKTALCHCLGIPLDLLYRIELGPCGICVVEYTAGDLNVLGTNLAAPV